jgi:hypothetical protein
MTSCVSPYIPSSYDHISLMQKVIISKVIGDCFIWKQISLDILLITTTHITHHCICHTYVGYKYKRIFLNSNLHFTFHPCFLTHTNSVSTKQHTRVLYRFKIAKLHRFLSHEKCTWKIKLSCIHETTTTHFVLIAVYFQKKLWNNSERMSSLTTCVSIYTPYSYMHIHLWTHYMYVFMYSSFMHISFSWFRS